MPGLQRGTSATWPQKTVREFRQDEEMSRIFCGLAAVELCMGYHKSAQGPHEGFS
jgi:hypothetical protein